MTHFVAGMGTSGTLMGAGRFLKEANPAIQIVGIEPRLGHKVQGLKNMKEAIVPEIDDVTRLDKKLTIDDEDAFAQARQLAVQKGSLPGCRAVRR